MNFLEYNPKIHKILDILEKWEKKNHDVSIKH